MDSILSATIEVSKPSTDTINVGTAPESGRTTPSWIVEGALVRQFGSFVLWLGIALSFYLLSFPSHDPFFALPFVLFILYYARLSQRLILVALWAEDTMRLLRASVDARHLAHRQLVIAERSQELPHFIVMIAAYKAGSSIGSVLESLNHQHYPAENYEVYVITHEAENEEKRNNLGLTEARILESILTEVPCRSGPATDIRILEEVFLEAVMKQQEIDIGVAQYFCFVAARDCLGIRRKVIRDQLFRKLIFDSFSLRNKGRSPEECMQLFERLNIHVTRQGLRLILNAADRSLSASNQVVSGFSKILGLGPDQPLFCSVSKPLRLAMSISEEDFCVRIQLLQLRRSLSSQLDCFLDRVKTELAGVKRRVIGLADLRGSVRKAYNHVHRTCPETVDEVLYSLGRKNFHHICHTKARAGKPESLNAGYEYILRHRPEVIAPNVFFLVIDADSLLHSSCLSTAACEILGDSGYPAIRQIVPISTSNFYGNNVLGKLVCCLDTIGSTGKWAWNTRTQRRPDLPAGSGVVIPAMLLDHLAQRKGAPWETGTVTEDARMIITDYGLMDCATRKTKFIPVYLLEAVPQGTGLFDTYRNYWIQRTRWASGGPDEVVELVKEYWGTRLYDRLESKTRDPWPLRRSATERIRARYRHTRLLVSWIGDHLWWGIGLGLAPVVWVLFNFFLITPRFFAVFGLLLFLGVPAFVIFRTFRKCQDFIPGGLRPAALFQLFSGSILLAWFLSFPIIYTQILFLLGRRKQFRKWTSTIKPQL